MIVLDASAYIDWLLDRVDPATGHGFDDDVAAPDLLFAETAAGIARAVRRGFISSAYAAYLLEEVRTAPIESTPTRDLVGRAFELRANLSLSDACYVALAEQLDCGVVTADQRLANSPGLTVPVTLV